MIPPPFSGLLTKSAPIIKRRERLNHRDKEATCSKNKVMKKLHAICDRRHRQRMLIESGKCGFRIRQLFHFHICHLLAIRPWASQSLSLLICKKEGWPTHRVVMTMKSYDDCNRSSTLTRRCKKMPCPGNEHTGTPAMCQMCAVHSTDCRRQKGMLH